MPKQSSKRPFDFKINSFEDVEKHLDALWKLHNQLVADPEDGCGCTDPPDCCQSGTPGFFAQPLGKKTGSTKRPSKKR